LTRSPLIIEHQLVERLLAGEDRHGAGYEHAAFSRLKAAMISG
jgi:hypothetical protein